MSGEELAMLFIEGFKRIPIMLLPIVLKALPCIIGVLILYFACKKAYRIWRQP